MKRVSRPHEDVEATMRRVEAKRRSHSLEVANHVVGLFFRRAVISLGSALDIDAMLVRAGKKEGFDSFLSFLTGDRVGHNHRVEMPEVWQAVGVINRSGDVESHS